MPWINGTEAQRELPYTRGSATSREAALAAAPKAESLRGCILDLIRAAGPDGVIDNEIEEQLNLRQSTISARRRELVIGGFVVDSGRKRKTRSGCNATVWVAA